MSYGNTFQSRLKFNFDTSKFGDGVDPYGDLEKRLADQPPLIRENTATLYTAISQSVVSTSTYYTNPLTPAITSLHSVVNGLYNGIWNYSIDDGSGGNLYLFRTISPGFATTYNSLRRELSTNDSNLDGTPKSFNTFVSHTNRLSNLSQSNKSSRPSFTTAKAVSQTVQALVYQYETTSTTTVGPLALGAFTSLFIKSDLENFLSILTPQFNSLTAILATNPVAVTPEITSLVTEVYANFSGLLSLLRSRRAHDEQFYQNAVSISKDLNTINTNKSMASTSSAITGYLINNVIGTTALKNL